MANKKINQENELKGDFICKVLFPVSKRPLPGQKLTYCLISFDLLGEQAAAPMIQLDGNWKQYRVIRAFKDKPEAEEFSKENSIVILEEKNSKFETGLLKIKEMLDQPAPKFVLEEGDLVAQVLYPVSQMPKPEQKLTYCLLSFDIPEYVAAPSIYLKGVSRSYKVVRAFKNKTEAKKYAKENSIEILEK